MDYEPCCDDICHGAGCIRAGGEEMIEICQRCNEPIEEDAGCVCDEDDSHDYDEESGSEMKPILTRDEVENGTRIYTDRHFNTAALNTITEAVELLRDIATNYDCDSDGHKYGTGCRACKAQAFLARYEGKEPTQENAK